MKGLGRVLSVIEDSGPLPYAKHKLYPSMLELENRIDKKLAGQLLVSTKQELVLGV